MNKFEKLQRDINTYIKKNNLSELLGIKLTEEGLLITIVNDISFDSGSAKVKERGEKIAKEVSKFLYIDPPHQIIISGHTDNRPIHTRKFESNWDLSFMRAVHFMRLILKNDNLDPRKFSAKGFGEHSPVAPNNSVENRARNRRVEVLILPNHEIKPKS
ncbi:OmpA family protein [Virgibacillus sp. L01]|uniref:OmpA family protein n=1 Tax=Virgibacillus sp. L01 TaxID=3457429 RepID=UPI003FD4BBB3